MFKEPLLTHPLGGAGSFDSSCRVNDVIRKTLNSGSEARHFAWILRLADKILPDFDFLISIIFKIIRHNI